MNDIIILGNGFDLAHGLATGYKDYVRAMLVDSLREKINRLEYKDSPFRIPECPEIYRTPSDEVNLSFLHYGYELENELLINLYRGTAKYHKYSLPDLIRHIIEDFKSTGWVDLEGTYFSLLTRILAQEKFDRARVIALNEQMEGLRKSLCQYLNKGTPTEPSDYINGHFISIREGYIMMAERQLKQNRETLRASDKQAIDTPERNNDQNDALEIVRRLSGITVLTFNYTDTCEALYKDTLTINTGDLPLRIAHYLPAEGIPPTFIHIHGSLKEEDIVLGYGDETTDKFRELEDANDNELTKYFKSFYYMQNPRYRQFFEVLEWGPFRLHLMGHSCGLSDRVLLSSIFNHPNLEDVRIYYHDRGEDGNDYFQLCQNISRHFHDKHAMRRKILPCKGEDPNMMSVPLIPHKTS